MAGVRLGVRSVRVIAIAAALASLAWAGVSLAALGVGTGDTCDWVAGAGNSATVVMTIPAGAPLQGGAAFGVPALTVTSASFTGISGGTFGTSGLPSGTSGEVLLSGTNTLNPSGAATVTVPLGLSGPAPASGNFTVVPTNSPPKDYYDAVSCGPFATSTTTTTSSTPTTTTASTGTTTTTTDTTAGPKPHVSNVDPSTGVRSGGTNVTITGTGFTGATGVAFGTVDAASFSVVSDTQITAVSPAYDNAGTVAVHVFGPGGHSQNLVGSANSFKYTSPPKTTTIGTTSTTSTTSTTGSTSLGSSGDTCAWSYTSGGKSATASLSIPAGAPPQGGAAFGIVGDGAGSGANVTSAGFNGIPVSISTNGLPSGTSGEGFLSSAINGAGAASVTIQLGASRSLIEDDDDVLTIVPTNFPATGYYTPVGCGIGSLQAPTTTATTGTSILGPTGDTCKWAPGTGKNQDDADLVLVLPAGAPEQALFELGAPEGLTITGASAELASGDVSGSEDAGTPGFPWVIAGAANGQRIASNGAAGSWVALVVLQLSGPPPAGASFPVRPAQLDVGDFDTVQCSGTSPAPSESTGSSGSQSTVDMTSGTGGGSQQVTADPVGNGLHNLTTYLLDVLLPGLGGLTWSQAPSNVNAPRSTGAVHSPLAAAPLVAPGLLVVSKAGKVTMNLLPTAAGKAVLKAKGSLTVPLQVTYTPAKGKPVSKLVTAKLTGKSTPQHATGPVAQITSVMVTTKSAVRSLVLKLHVSEKATAKLVLRTGSAPFSDSFPVKAGQNTVTVALPKWVGSGKAQLLLVLTDAQSKTRRYRTTVSVPA